MRRTLQIMALAGLALAGLSLVRAAGAAENPARQATPTTIAKLFRGDRRLAVPLDAAEKDRPLGEYLRDLGRQLGVPLEVDRSAADDKLNVYQEQVPAAELLTRLGRHLELDWLKGRSGYVLVEGDAARGRRERQHGEEWQGIQHWMERLATVVDLSDEAASTRRQEAEQGLKDAALTPDRRQQLEEELALLADRQRHTRAVPVAVRIYRTLTLPQQEALRTNGFLRLSSAYQTLSPAVVEATHDALKSNSPFEKPKDVRHADITFTLEEVARDRDRPNGARQLRLYVELVAVRPDRSTSMLNWRPRSPAAGMTSVAAVPKDDPELARPVELKLEPHVPPAVAESGATGYLFNQWPETVTLGEVCETLHHATGWNVVADSFTRTRLRPATLKKVKTAGELLETLTRELDYAWAREGGQLRLWSTTRAYDRAAEAPERVLRPFRKRMAAQPAPTVDDYAGLATALTDSQCRGLTDFWGYYLEGTGVAPLWVSGGIYEARHQLRLWASLSGAQRRQAVEMLPSDAMTPAQRRQLALAISAPGDDLSRPDCLRIPTPESLPGLRGGFKLKQREVEVQAFQDEKGNLTATLSTVGAGRGFRGFDRFGPPSKPLGPIVRMPAVDFLFYVMDGGAEPKFVRSNNLHLVPRYGG